MPRWRRRALQRAIRARFARYFAVNRCHTQFGLPCLTAAALHVADCMGHTTGLTHSQDCNIQC